MIIQNISSSDPIYVVEQFASEDQFGLCPKLRSDVREHNDIDETSIIIDSFEKRTISEEKWYSYFTGYTPTYIVPNPNISYLIEPDPNNATNNVLAIPLYMDNLLYRTFSLSNRNNYIFDTEHQGGNLIVNFKLCATEDFLNYYSGFQFFIAGPPSMGMSLGSDHKFYYMHSGTQSQFPIPFNSQIDENIWHSFKFDINLNEAKYDIYMDDALAVTAISITTNFNFDSNRFIIRAFSGLMTEPTPNPRLLIDDIDIKWITPSCDIGKDCVVSEKGFNVALQEKSAEVGFLSGINNPANLQLNATAFEGLSGNDIYFKSVKFDGMVQPIFDSAGNVILYTSQSQLNSAEVEEPVDYLTINGGIEQEVTRIRWNDDLSGGVVIFKNDKPGVAIGKIMIKGVVPWTFSNYFEELSGEDCLPLEDSDQSLISKFSVGFDFNPSGIVESFSAPSTRDDFVDVFYGELMHDKVEYVERNISVSELLCADGMNYRDRSYTNNWTYSATLPSIVPSGYNYLFAQDPVDRTRKAMKLKNVGNSSANTCWAENRTGYNIDLSDFTVKYKYMFDGDLNGSQTDCEMFLSGNYVTNSLISALKTTSVSNQNVLQYKGIHPTYQHLQMNSLSANQWYQIQLDVNSVDKTLDLFIDETLVTGDMKTGLTNWPPFNTIRFKSPISLTGHYFKDLEIYKNTEFSLPDKFTPSGDLKIYRTTSYFDTYGMMDVYVFYDKPVKDTLANSYILYFGGISNQQCTADIELFNYGNNTTSNIKGTIPSGPRAFYSVLGDEKETAWILGGTTSYGSATNRVDKYQKSVDAIYSVNATNQYSLMRSGYASIPEIDKGFIFGGSAAYVFSDAGPTSPQASNYVYSFDFSTEVLNKTTSPLIPLWMPDKGLDGCVASTNWPINDTIYVFGGVRINTTDNSFSTYQKEVIQVFDVASTTPAVSYVPVKYTYINEDLYEGIPLTGYTDYAGLPLTGELSEVRYGSFIACDFEKIWLLGGISDYQWDAFVGGGIRLNSVVTFNYVTNTMSKLDVRLTARKGEGASNTNIGHNVGYFAGGGDSNTSFDWAYYRDLKYIDIINFANDTNCVKCRTVLSKDRVGIGGALV